MPCEVFGSRVGLAHLAGPGLIEYAYLRSWTVEVSDGDRARFKQYVSPLKEELGDRSLKLATEFLLKNLFFGRLVNSYGELAKAETSVKK